MKISLRTRVTLTFVGVVGAIIILFILLNTVYWSQVYLLQNRTVLKDTYESLASVFRTEDVSSANIADILRSAKLGRNVSIAIEGENEWEFTTISDRFVSEYEQEFLRLRMQAAFLQAEEEGVAVVEKTPEYTMQIVNADARRMSDRYLEMFGILADQEGNSSKFIISLPLQGMQTMSVDWTRFFVYGSILMLLVGCIIVLILTNRMTKPIMQLSEISKRMTNLDFSARYTGDREDEVGILGNNMNEMSAQLEKTISELQEANAQLQKDNEALNEVDAMRKDFISSVSHELKTPIALIQGYAEGLKDLKDDPESQDYYTDVIIDEADRMNRLVKKLTSLNQLEFNQEAITKEPFDVMQMIREIVAGSKKLQEEHHAAVELTGPETCIVLADEFRIEEVFNNYYSNAFNHLEAPGKIRISAEETADKIRISVFNTGNPIPEEELDKIWIKFYKVDKARTRAYGGSGIGLSIVKAVMDLHHEAYGVKNETDGVTFWFELSKVQADPAGADAKDAEGSTDQEFSGRKMSEDLPYLEAEYVEVSEKKRKREER
ncbi:MAG: HAMP domain-containing protein [Lachnospiraceae bacterium]|nr:HAMP domain-containing protein [Lachnospiraceae bacterium]